MIHAQTSLVVLAIVFGSAMLGLLLRRILPQDHMADQTRSVVTVSMGVVGTLTALVLGLLIAAASSSFNTKNEEVILISADVIRLDRLLRRYGPEAEGLRDLLRRYTARKIQNLFPRGPPSCPTQRILGNFWKSCRTGWRPWMRATLTSGGLESRRYNSSAPSPGHDGFWSSRTGLGSKLRYWCCGVLVFWLSLLFWSFGLFAPSNATAILALFLCAVAGAIEMVQDLNVPFQGIIRISSKPMKDALDEISLK